MTSTVPERSHRTHGFEPLRPRIARTTVGFFGTPSFSPRLVERRSRLVEIEAKPFNAETPMDVLAEPETPTAAFYVRNHFDVPRVAPESWRLRIDGAVERSMALSLSDLERFPQRTLSATLECAGNGRASMDPTPPGTPWRFGACGTARFTGVPLAGVLQKAGPRRGAREALLVGADRGEVEPGQSEVFARSLPMAVALNGDALLAWEMNGEPLTRDHGAPLRLVVPRWYGIASVKWLTGITVLARPFDGYFQKEKYVYVGESGTPDGAPVTVMRVRSVIGRPADGARLHLGPIEVAGTAWSGSGAIRGVDVSADDGRSWSPATLHPNDSPLAATPWRHRWVPPRPGSYVLMARATDDAGNTQPLGSTHNVHGYGNNVVHRVRLTVVR